MSRNYFASEGNIGRDPVLKYVPVKGEQKPVLEFDVKFQYDRVNTQTGEFEDRGGFWATVTYWGKRAEHANRILKSGMRVWVEGEMSQEEYVATKGERAGQVMTATNISASFIGLSLLGIESVTLAPRKNRPGAGANGGPEGSGTDSYDERDHEAEHGHYDQTQADYYAQHNQG